MAKLYRPKLIICGSSAYTRMDDVNRLRQVADQYQCKLRLDLSHEAGLIAANVIPSDVSTADVVTMSLDKTLRGPFGGLILCKKYLASIIDRAVHPGAQSSFPIRKIINAVHSMLSTQTNDLRDTQTERLRTPTT